MKTNLFALTGSLALAMSSVAMSAPAVADYREPIANDMSKCTAASGPALLVTVNGISKSSGKIRVQSYHATSQEWLEKGKWLHRIEQPARAGTMRFCLPLDGAGSYGVAVRHDVNGNGKTDLSTDGGAMSNNPSLNIFNLGRPSYKKTAVAVGNGVVSISINMRYM